MTALAAALTLLSFAWAFGFGVAVGWIFRDNERRLDLCEALRRLESGHSLEQIRQWVKTELGKSDNNQPSKLGGLDKRGDANR